MTRHPLAVALLLSLAAPMGAAAPGGASHVVPPPLAAMPVEAASVLRPLIERYRADRATLEHVRALGDEGRDPLHAPRRAALRAAQVAAWQERLAELDVDALGQDDRLDLLLLQRDLALDAEAQRFTATRYEAIRPLLPGYEALVALLEDRRDLRQAAPRSAADTLEQARADLEARGRRLAPGEGSATVSPTLALRAAQHAAAP